MVTADPTTRRWPPRVQGEWTVDDPLDTPDDGQQYWIVDTEVPAITVFDLLEGTYRVTATAFGSDDLAVTDPLAVTVSPSSLVGRGL